MAGYIEALQFIILIHPHRDKEAYANRDHSRNHCTENGSDSNAYCLHADHASNADAISKAGAAKFWRHEYAEQ